MYVVGTHEEELLACFFLCYLQEAGVVRTGHFRSGKGRLGIVPNRGSDLQYLNLESYVLGRRSRHTSNKYERLHI